MDGIIREKSASELSYVERILREEMEREPINLQNNASPSALSNSMIPPHRYRFQQLKSYNSKSEKQDINETKSTSSMLKPEGSSPENGLTQPRSVKTRSIWCGGPFFCVPKKNKTHMKKSSKIRTDVSDTNDHLLPTTDIDNTFGTYDSSKLIDETNEVKPSTKRNLSSITDSDKKLLANSAAEKDLQIDTLMQEIDENRALLEEYSNLKILSIEQDRMLQQQNNQQHSNKVELLENRIKAADESINKYVNDIKEQKVTISKLEGKLKMSEITEDLFLKEKHKSQIKIKELKAKHENEILELQQKIEGLKSNNEEQYTMFLSSLQKVSSLFDSCKNFNDDNAMLHGDLEYTINMLESSLVDGKREIDSLRAQAAENQHLIHELESGFQEKSTLINEITEIFKEFSLETPQSNNPRWINSFRDKLEKLRNNSTLSGENTLSLGVKTDVNSTNDEGLKHVVSPIVDEIMVNSTNLEENDDTDDQFSLTVASRFNEKVTDKKSFELESISVEKVTNFSSQEDEDNI